MEFQHVLLKVARGFIEVKEFILAGDTRCIIGRASDCDIRLPPSIAHADVSRHHCMIEIQGPNIQVRDLGSRNGTFVNGEKIGQRPLTQPVEQADLRECPAVELKDGDEVQVGKTVFRVDHDTTVEASKSMSVPMYFV
jgi:eukaryotic-like serine/threonine-protein kinase